MRWSLVMWLGLIFGVRSLQAASAVGDSHGRQASGPFAIRRRLAEQIVDILNVQLQAGAIGTAELTVSQR
ncbi:MAG: hypothetical protein ACREIC_34570 [Limisphaerales bacterium]